MLIDGREIAKQNLEDLKARVADLTFQPVLCDIIVGNNPVSHSYVRIKSNKAKAAGLDFVIAQLPLHATEEEIIEEIQQQQDNPNLCGLIVQLPLPETINTQKVLDAINPSVDVDVLGSATKDLFYNYKKTFTPPTAGAIMQILDSLDLEWFDEHFVVMGQGELVGRPVAKMLLDRGITLDIIDSKTENALEILDKATVVITGVGKPEILRGEMLKNGVVIIDAGTSESGGSILGDVHFASVAEKARLITPVPGGVGPVTVVKLIENVIISAEKRK